MKDWINENKFMAGCIGIFGLLALLIGGAGFVSKFSTEADLKKEILKLSNDNKALTGSYGNASQMSADRLTDEAIERYDLGLNLYEKLSEAAFHKLDLTKSDTDFSALLNGYVSRLKKVMQKENVKYDSKSMFGFEEYASNTIISNSEAIGLALYQMEAFEWLLKKVASLQPQELNTFTRVLLKEESEEESGAEKKKNGTQVKNAVFRRMEFGMTLTLDEQQMAELLELLSNSKEHLFILKGFRFQNEKVSPIDMPRIMIGEEESTEAVLPESDFTTNFEADGLTEEDQPEEKVFDKGEKILEQVYGKEKLKVVLDLELLLLDEEEAPTQSILAK